MTKYNEFILKLSEIGKLYPTQGIYGLAKNIDKVKEGKDPKVLHDSRRRVFWKWGGRIEELYHAWLILKKEVQEWEIKDEMAKGKIEESKDISELNAKIKEMKDYIERIEKYMAKKKVCS